jgi:hypothetical protein
MHDALVTPDPESGQFDPRNAIYGEVWRTPSRAAAEDGRRRSSAAARTPFQPWPPDL